MFILQTKFEKYHLSVGLLTIVRFFYEKYLDFEKLENLMKFFSKSNAFMHLNELFNKIGGQKICRW